MTQDSRTDSKVQLFTSRTKATIWNVVFVVVITGFLFYWLPHTRRSWEEEVKLHDGTVIVVDRSVKRDRFGGEAGFSGDVVSQKIKFSANGEQIVWKDDITPIIFDVVNSTYFVVAAPMLHDKCGEHGNPNPPFIFYKYEKGHWNSIRPSELPNGLQRNLLVNFWGPQHDSKLTLRRKEQVDRVSRDLLIFNKNLMKSCDQVGHAQSVQMKSFA